MIYFRNLSLTHHEIRVSDNIKGFSISSWKEIFTDSWSIIQWPAFLLVFKTGKIRFAEFYLVKAIMNLENKKTNGCCIWALKAIKVDKSLYNLPSKSHSIRKLMWMVFEVSTFAPLSIDKSYKTRFVKSNCSIQTLFLYRPLKKYVFK